MSTTLRIELFPADLTETKRFYCSALGFVITRDDRNAPSPYLALARGDVQVGAAQRLEPQEPIYRRPPSGVELVLEVDDLAAERRRVSESGWPIDEEVSERAWGLKDFRISDPDGYYWRVTTR